MRSELERPVLDQRYLAPALKRGLQVLLQFTRVERELTGAELSRRLGLPRASVFRLLQTLEQMGFLERLPDGINYRLGLAVLRLGFEYLAAVELPEAARPILEHMRDATGHSTQLAILDGHDVVVVAKASAPSAFASSVHVGTRMPAHATVLGQVLLASMDARSLERLYPSGSLPPSTARSPRTVAELRRALDAIKTKNYAVSESGFESGISAIATPVRNSSAHAVAALSLVVALPAFDNAATRERLVTHVLDAAATLSHRLNYRPL